MISNENPTVATVVFVFPHRILSHQQKKEEKMTSWVKLGCGSSCRRLDAGQVSISAPRTLIISVVPPPPPPLLLLHLLSSSTSAELLLCFVLFLITLFLPTRSLLYVQRAKIQRPKKPTLNLLKGSAEIMVPKKCQSHWFPPPPPPSLSPPSRP